MKLSQADTNKKKSVAFLDPPTKASGNEAVHAEHLHPKITFQNSRGGGGGRTTSSLLGLTCSYSENPMAGGVSIHPSVCPRLFFTF